MNDPDPQIADAITLLMASTGRTEEYEQCKKATTTTAETPTMTDIERISEKSGCDKPYVRAVVAAMLEPSEGMLNATTSERKFTGHPEASESSRRRQMAGFQAAAKGHWQAMIRHILNETKG